MIENIDYHITDRCNLKCVGCNNFCPFVPSDIEDPSIEQIKEDFELISKFKDSFGRLSLLGGEPTLHNQLDEILDLARQYFPKNDIVLVTNGLLVNRIIELVEKFVNNNIRLIVTVYPYADKFKEQYEKIIQNFPNHLLTIWDFSDENGTLWFQTKMLSNEILNTAEETHQCSLRVCTQYRDKKLYLCGYHANFHYFKTYYGNKIKFEDDDVAIDLTKCEDASQIENFIKYAVPNICLHCRAADKVCLLVPWTQSQRDINEYIS